jgi:IMP dehydrogenase
MSNILLNEGLSFDDVLLVPDYSAILPDEVQTRTRLTKELELNIPIVSAAMDTVTEALTAISMARAGGLGFIHRNLTIQEQTIEVDRVKKSESGMIVDPVTITPDISIFKVLEIMAKYRISGIPVIEDEKLVGIVTNRDLRFETNLEKPAKDVMTSENLVTVREKCTLEESKKLLHQHRIENFLLLTVKANLKV